MSNIGDKVKGFFNMDSMYDEGYDDYDAYDDDYDTEETVKQTKSERKAARSTSKAKESFYEAEDDYVEEKPAKAAKRTNRPAKVVQMNNARNRNVKAEIIIFKPTNLDDTKEIVDTLLEGKAIILNFEGTNTDLAQRIIDNVSGACCAVDGTLKRIAGYIYIVVPVSIYLEGEFSDMSASNSFDYKSNRYQY